MKLRKKTHVCVCVCVCVTWIWVRHQVHSLMPNLLSTITSVIIWCYIPKLLAALSWFYPPLTLVWFLTGVILVLHTHNYRLSGFHWNFEIVYRHLVRSSMFLQATLTYLHLYRLSETPSWTSLVAIVSPSLFLFDIRWCVIMIKITSSDWTAVNLVLYTQIISNAI